MIHHRRTTETDRQPCIPAGSTPFSATRCAGRAPIHRKNRSDGCRAKLHAQRSPSKRRRGCECCHVECEQHESFFVVRLREEFRTACANASREPTGTLVPSGRQSVAGNARSPHDRRQVVVHDQVGARVPEESFDLRPRRRGISPARELESHHPQRGCGSTPAGCPPVSDSAESDRNLLFRAQLARPTATGRPFTTSRTE